VGSLHDLASFFEQDLHCPPLRVPFDQLGRCGGSSVETTASSQPSGRPAPFRIVEPRLKNPRTEHWERVFRVFHLLL
jgi:hypothetical protein